MTLKPSTMNLLGGVCLVVLGACSSGDNRIPTGSQQLSTSSDFSAIYVANTDQGTISVVDRQSGLVHEVRAGLEPTRIARANGRLFVTLRASRSVAVFEEKEGTLELVSRVVLGAEPFGAVASRNGEKVYVAVSLEDRVVEMDAKDLSVGRSWNVPHQPRWLALHPAGDMLFVASAYEGALHAIDLAEEGAEPQLVPLPQAMGQPVKGTGPNVLMTRRITGDPAVSPDGGHLLVPAMYIDNLNVVDESERPGRPDSNGYFSSPGGRGRGSTRFNPVVVDVRLAGDAPVAPETSPIISAFGSIDQTVVAGYPANVAVSPDSKLFLVSIEGAQGVVVATLDDEDGANAGASAFITGDQYSFELPRRFRNRITVATDRGPRSIVFTGDDTAYVYAFLDRTVASVDLTKIRQMLLPEDEGDEPVPFVERSDVVADLFIQGGLEVTEPVLGDQVERGRAMFYATNDSRVVSVGAGLSCATCHFDGRNDGLSWTFERGLRQTPSLAGVVSMTNPVRWEGDRESVAADAMSTSQGLMGGAEMTHADSLDLEAFIDWTRDADVPLKGSSDPALTRGKAIFERADTQCATCHAGARYTDNKLYDLLGLEGVKTRSLVGVAATAPYFHDGSAATLRDVLLRAKDGSMGSTANLSEAEMSDLEVYLRSL